MMDLVRLNKIEFGRVELQKIILGLAGSFWTSRVEGVLLNGYLEHKYQHFVSV